MHGVHANLGTCALRDYYFGIFFWKNNLSVKIAKYILLQKNMFFLQIKPPLVKKLTSKCKNINLNKISYVYLVFDHLLNFPLFFNFAKNRNAIIQFGSHQYIQSTSKDWSNLIFDGPTFPKPTILIQTLWEYHRSFQNVSFDTL